MPVPLATTGTRPRLPLRRYVIGYAALAAVMLVTRLPGVGEGAHRVSTVTQWLLAPALALAVATLAARPWPRLVRWALVALGWCFLGDLLPSLVPDGGSNRFLVMVGAFFVAQLSWIVAFWPWRGAAFRGRRRWAATAYGLVAVALLAVCVPAAGPLAVPVVGYAAALTTMAVLALGPDRVVAWGGALFLVSDSLIAIEAFAPRLTLPGHGVWVMATYAAALALLAFGAVRTGR